MTERPRAAGAGPTHLALTFAPVRRADGITIEQAPARNNSWYLIVYDPTGTCEVRYASQSANQLVASGVTAEAARAAAESHASRYDTRV